MGKVALGKGIDLVSDIIKSVTKKKKTKKSTGPKPIKQGGSNRSRTKGQRRVLANIGQAKKAVKAKNKFEGEKRARSGKREGAIKSYNNAKRDLSIAEKKLADANTSNQRVKLSETIAGLEEKMKDLSYKNDIPGASGLVPSKPRKGPKAIENLKPKDNADKGRNVKLEHDAQIRKGIEKFGLKPKPKKKKKVAPKETLPKMQRQLTLASFNKFLKEKGLPPVKSLPKIGNRVKMIKKKTGGTIKREGGGKIQMAKASWMDGLTKKQIDEILGRPTRDSSGVKKSDIKKKSKPIKVKPAKAGGALKPKKSAYKTGGVIKRNTGGRIAPSKGWGKARIK